MSVQDTIEMLAKRASGEKPEPEHSEKEVRLFALEMQKQAISGSSLLYNVGWEAPERVGRGLGHVGNVVTAPAKWMARKGLGVAAHTGADAISRLAALPFDAPGLSLAGGFAALDLAHRMKNSRIKVTWPAR